MRVVPGVVTIEVDHAGKAPSDDVEIFLIGFDDYRALPANFEPAFLKKRNDIGLGASQSFDELTG